MKHLSRVLSTGIPQGYSGISPEGAVEIEPLICNFHSTYFDKKCLKPKYGIAFTLIQQALRRDPPTALQSFFGRRVSTFCNGEDQYLSLGVYTLRDAAL